MAQRQPTPQQIDAAQRILAHDHKRTYAQGAKGTTIRAIQIMLASKGYAPGKFDGVWGTGTQGAWDKMMSDRGWAYSRATPKALADVSKEIGQPLPRQRPPDAGQFIGGNGMMPPDVTGSASGDAMPSPPADVSMQAAIPPQPAAQPATPLPDPNEFGPAMLSLDRSSYNPIADTGQVPQMGTRQFVDELPALPPTPPDQGLPSNDQMRNLAGLPALPPTSPPQVPGASPAPNFDAGRYNDEFGPGQPQDNGDLLENLSTVMFGAGQPQEPPGVTTLRQALINQQGPYNGRPDFPAPNQMNALEALRRALLADRTSKVAGY